MTEAQWLACDDPGQMLHPLRIAGKLSERKLRLFTVACCRGVWHLLRDERCRTLVEVVERYADGTATERELTLARRAAAGSEILPFTRMVPVPEAFRAARRASEWAAGVRYISFDVAEITRPEQLAYQASVLRDLSGSWPVRRRRVARGILDWNAGTVRRLAAAVYAERAFDRLPLVADALEDAGCTDAALPGHLRGPGPHVRGCWAVDLLTGKS